MPVDPNSPHLPLAVRRALGQPGTPQTDRRTERGPARAALSLGPAVAEADPAVASTYLLFLKAGKFDLAYNTRADLDATFDAFAQVAGEQRLVLHFHGGLVDTNDALAEAAYLFWTYAGADSFPIFTIWESGLSEILGTNWAQIFGSPEFQALRAHVHAAAADKAGNLPAGTTSAQEAHVRIMRAFLDDRATVPAADLTRTPPALTPAEREALRQRIDRDPVIERAVERIGSAQAPAGSDALFSRDVVAEIVRHRTAIEAGAADAAERNFGASAGDLVDRILERIALGRDHGFDATVVEEILRTFYFDSVGADVWNAMKGDIAASFAADPQAGSRAMADRIKLLAGSRLRVTLVGHSAGGIYVNGFLDYVEQSFGAVDLQFDVVLLAPANTMTSFAQTLQSARKRIRSIRIFQLHDALERKDEVLWIDHSTAVPPWYAAVYPSSLLYVISGLLENNALGDEPLVGMERFYGDRFAGSEFAPTVGEVKAYLANVPASRIEAITPEPGTDGQRSAATYHAALASADDETRQSVRFILLHGL